LGANGNPTFYRLKELFSGDPNGNYGSLMTMMMMNTYCKDPETEDTYRGVRSATRVAKTNAASSTSQQGNNGYYQRIRKADKATMRCFNCKTEGHLVSDCPDPRCYTCTIQFATLAERKEHETVVTKEEARQ
jgi:hypothetical protein